MVKVEAKSRVNRSGGSGPSNPGLPSIIGKLAKRIYMSSFFNRMRLESAALMYDYGMIKQAYSAMASLVQDVIKESQHGPAQPQTKQSFEKAGKEIENGRNDQGS